MKLDIHSILMPSGNPYLAVWKWYGHSHNNEQHAVRKLFILNTLFFLENIMKIKHSHILAGIFITTLPLGNVVNAGIITLDQYQDNALSFTSTWTWTNQPNNNGWATQGATDNLNFIEPIDGQNNWYVSLEGFANGSLTDVSVHEINPHNDGDVPHSFFDYPGAFAGAGPVFSFIAHGNHSDEYSLTSAVQANGSVLIDFSGLHLDGTTNGSCSINGGTVDCLSKTVVPLPPAIWLFGSGLLSILYFRKKNTITL